MIAWLVAIGRVVGGLLTARRNARRETAEVARIEAGTDLDRATAAKSLIDGAGEVSGTALELLRAIREEVEGYRAEIASYRDELHHLRADHEDSLENERGMRDLVDGLQDRLRDALSRAITDDLALRPSRTPTPMR